MFSLFGPKSAEKNRLFLSVIFQRWLDATLVADAEAPAILEKKISIMLGGGEKSRGISWKIRKYYHNI